MKPGDTVHYVGPHVIDGVADDAPAGGCRHEATPVEKTALDWVETLEIDDEVREEIFEDVQKDDGSVERNVRKLVKVGKRKRVQQPRQYFDCGPDKVVPAHETCGECGRTPDHLYGAEAMIIAILDPNVVGPERNVLVAFKKKRYGLHDGGGLVRNGHARWTTLSRLITPTEWTERKAQIDQHDALKAEALSKLADFLEPYKP